MVSSSSSSSSDASGGSSGVQNLQQQSETLVLNCLHSGALASELVLSDAVDPCLYLCVYTLQG
jgi:hypothetical protein